MTNHRIFRRLRLFKSSYDSFLATTTYEEPGLFIGHAITYHGRFDAAVALKTKELREEEPCEEDSMLLESLLDPCPEAPFGGLTTFGECLEYLKDHRLMCTVVCRTFRIHGVILELGEDQLLLNRYFRLGDDGGHYKRKLKNVIGLEYGGSQHRQISENALKQEARTKIETAEVLTKDRKLKMRQRYDPQGLQWRINIE